MKKLSKLLVVHLRPYVGSEVVGTVVRVQTKDEENSGKVKGSRCSNPMQMPIRC